MLLLAAGQPPVARQVAATGASSSSRRLPAVQPRVGRCAASSRRCPPLAAASTEAEIVPEVALDESSPAAIRKCLTSAGWEKAWVDVVTDRVTKGANKATVSSCQAVVDKLTALGIPSNNVCNMAAITHEIMAVPAGNVDAVVDYVRRRGVDGPMLVSLLEAYPKLLTFGVTADGTKLAKGKARAEVDVVEMGGQRKALVSFWREGANFKSAPVSPVQPQDA